MDRLAPPETRARRLFVRASGVLFIAVIQLLLIQMVALYLDDRLINRGSGPLYRIGDLIANGQVLWLIALIKFALGAWEALRQPWPQCAKQVPGNLGWCALVLTWGLPWIHPDWTWMGTAEHVISTFFVMMGWSIGIPIACFLVVYYGSARWLLGPKPKPAPLPYAASSASRSSDGKPLWGYRLIFVTLGCGLLLFAAGFVLERPFTALVVASLAMGCFCQWRDLQYQRFTPAVWYRGLSLMGVLIIASYVAFNKGFANAVALFFGLCIINWIAATARHLFFRRNVQMGSGVG